MTKVNATCWQCWLAWAAFNLSNWGVVLHYILPWKLSDSPNLSLSSCRSRLSLPGACSMRNCASMTGECRACKMHWANFKAASSAVKMMTRLCHDMCHPVCHSLALWKMSSTIISMSQATLTLVIFLTSTPCLLMPHSVGAPTTCAICTWEDIPTRLEGEGIQCDTQKGPSSDLRKLARFQSWPSGMIHSLQPIQTSATGSSLFYLEVSGSSDVMVRPALSEGLPVVIYCKSYATEGVQISSASTLATPCKPQTPVAHLPEISKTFPNLSLSFPSLFAHGAAPSEKRESKWLEGYRSCTGFPRLRGAGNLHKD